MKSSCWRTPSFFFCASAISQAANHITDLIIVRQVPYAAGKKNARRHLPYRERRPWRQAVSHLLEPDNMGHGEQTMAQISARVNMGSCTFFTPRNCNNFHTVRLGLAVAKPGRVADGNYLEWRVTARRWAGAMGLCLKVVLVSPNTCCM